MKADSSRSLREFVTLRRGTTYKSGRLHEDGPVLLGLSSINPGGGFRSDALKTYGGDSPAEITLGPGDIYVSLKDVTQSGNLLGAVARVPHGISAGRLTQDTVKLICSDQAQADYIYWLLRTPEYREYCMSHAIGVTTLALPREDFLNFPVPNRSVERDAIVHAADALDKKIAHNDRLRANLLAYGRVIYRANAPVRLRVGEIACLERGLSYKGSGLVLSGGLAMLNLANFSTTGWCDRRGLKFYSGDHRERHEVTEGDLLVANTDLTQRREILGQPLLVPRGLQKALYSHHLFAVKFAVGEEPYRLAVYFGLQTQAFRDRAETFASGTTVAALPQDAVLDFPCPVPEGERLNEFNRMIEPLIALCWLTEDESTRLALVRDWLLRRLVAGRGSRDVCGEHIASFPEEPKLSPAP